MPRPPPFACSGSEVNGRRCVPRAPNPRPGRRRSPAQRKSETAAEPRSRERLRREAMAVAAIDHPYICKIFEIGEHGEALFLVMEYVAVFLKTNVNILKPGLI